MKPALKKTESVIYYFVDGKKILGASPRINGDVSGISGNVDDCKITQLDRDHGIDISELVAK